MDERQRRKLDHVRLAVAQGQEHQGRLGPVGPGWQDVHLVHQSLPELALEEIDLATTLGGVALSRPVIINAMTGGAAGVETINRELASVAADLGLAMAVGSQTAGLRDPAVARTYRVVREAHPHGVIMANLSANASVAEGMAAVEMVEANLLQLHLNAPQELAMPEGDRDFRGVLERIQSLVEAVPVPVVVKECGFGLSREAARQLYAAGVRVVDISGHGGTNFAWIEAERQGVGQDPGLTAWGIPTAAALAEVSALELEGLDIIGSGGIHYGTEAAKALALGARAVGVAGAVLRHHQSGGARAAHQFLQQLLGDLSTALLLCGAATVGEMQRCPVVITGRTGEWCHLRGVNLAALAQRTKGE